MEMASSKLRRALAQNRTFRRAESELRDSAVPHNQIGRKSASKRHGAAVILDFNDKGATVKFRGHTCKIARCCARKRREPLGVSNVELDGSPRITLVGGKWDTLRGDCGVRADLLPYVDEVSQGSVAPSSRLLSPRKHGRKQVFSLSPSAQLPPGESSPA